MNPLWRKVWDDTQGRWLDSLGQCLFPASVTIDIVLRHQRDWHFDVGLGQFLASHHLLADLYSRFGHMIGRLSGSGSEYAAFRFEGCDRIGRTIDRDNEEIVAFGLLGRQLYTQSSRIVDGENCIQMWISCENGCS